MDASVPSEQALPLDVRRRVLRSVITEKEHRLEFVKSKDVRVNSKINSMAPSPGAFLRVSL